MGSRIVYSVWSAGQENIRGNKKNKNKNQTSEKLGRMQRRVGNNHKIKTDAWRIHARAQHEEGHSLESVWYIASHEPPDTSPDRNYLIFAPKSITSTPYSQGFNGFPYYSDK